MTPQQRIKDQLNFIYSEKKAKDTWGEIEELIKRYQRNDFIIKRKKISDSIVLDERDAILITYGDQLYDGEHLPLQCLYESPLNLHIAEMHHIK